METAPAAPPPSKMWMRSTIVLLGVFMLLLELSSQGNLKTQVACSANTQRGFRKEDQQTSSSSVSRSTSSSSSLSPPPNDDGSGEWKLDDACASIQIPVVVAAHNNPTLIKSFVQELRSCLDADVIIADMDSRYPPMIEYLESIEKNLTHDSKVRVVRLPNNGPHDFFHSNHQLYDQLPRFFAYTDGDLRLNSFIPRNALCVLAHLTQRLDAAKVGFALDISNTERMWGGNYIREMKIWQWEDAMFASPVKEVGTKYRWPMLEGMLFQAQIDTTFAVHDKAKLPCKELCFTYAGIRVGGVFTAKHLPWYPEILPAMQPGEVQAMLEGGGTIATMLRKQGILGPEGSQGEESWNEVKFKEELPPKRNNYDDLMKSTCHLSELRMEIPH